MNETTILPYQPCYPTCLLYNETCVQLDSSNKDNEVVVVWLAVVMDEPKTGHTRSQQSYK